MPEHHPLQLLHVVRRYGPVGGMERYVFELTQALQARGHAVTVLCERCHQPPSPGVVVHEIGEVRPKPRWLASLRFSAGVERWVQSRPQAGWIIHSHERTPLHHVTTFHGPPFATVRARPLWRRLSLRIGFQLHLERRELTVARAIAPVSAAVSTQLAAYYPDAAGKLTAPVIPGVLPGAQRRERAVPATGGIIGFVGKEWRRKGLQLAADAVAKLRAQRPEAELWVVGPHPDEVRHLFADWNGGHRLLGWRDGTDHLAQFDLLLHPARAEPFGMVITEAMAARVPVVVSDICGAATQVSPDFGRVLTLRDPAETWAAAMQEQLARPAPPPAYTHGWDAVAADYERIYAALPAARTLTTF